MLVVALATVECGGSSPETDEAKDGVQKFLDGLDKAVRDGDTATRVALLHPAVIARYGEQQCRDFLAGPLAQPDPSRRDKVVRVDKPAPFEFSMDDGTIPLADARLVIVEETFQKRKSERELHVAPVNGRYRYFIDCGTPLMRQ